MSSLGSSEPEFDRAEQDFRSGLAIRFGSGVASRAQAGRRWLNIEAADVLEGQIGVVMDIVTQALFMRS